MSGEVLVKQITKIKLQKWVQRTISNSHYRARSSPLFVKYNILNVYDKYKLETGAFMYKYSNSLLPDGFNNLCFLLQDLKYMIITLDITIIIIKPEMFELFSDHSIRIYGPEFT